MGLENEGGVNHLALTRTRTLNFCQHLFTIHFATKAAITHTLEHSRNYRSTRRKFIKSCLPQQSKAALWSTGQGSKQGKPLAVFTERSLNPAPAVKGAVESGVIACREFSAHHSIAAEAQRSRFLWKRCALGCFLPVFLQSSEERSGDCLPRNLSPSAVFTRAPFLAPQTSNFEDLFSPDRNGHLQEVAASFSLQAFHFS